MSKTSPPNIKQEYKAGKIRTVNKFNYKPTIVHFQCIKSTECTRNVNTKTGKHPGICKINNEMDIMYYKCIKTEGCTRTINNKTGKHTGCCEVPENRCILCGDNLGENNPRQLCGKIRCYN